MLGMTHLSYKPTPTCLIGPKFTISYNFFHQVMSVTTFGLSELVRSPVGSKSNTKLIQYGSPVG